ncbi:hypothetical protein C5167_005795 [Papaver somniferum]|uniref:Uncharacterized protein n=1 Tax=Papaver somniferum TaxID=3469 RepID=A0A4Y7JBK6_PAPSO|nr:hypothetical protein C5167_005795 [Papaver somniferum]
MLLLLGQLVIKGVGNILQSTHLDQDNPALYLLHKNSERRFLSLSNLPSTTVTTSFTSCTPLDLRTSPSLFVKTLKNSQLNSVVTTIESTFTDHQHLHQSITNSFTPSRIKFRILEAIEMFTSMRKIAKDKGVDHL